MAAEVQRREAPDACCEGDRHRTPPRSARWTRIATGLVAGAMLYNIIEAVIATTAGTKAESVALFGFGLDSVIECAAAAVMLWRLRVEARGADPEEIEASEKVVRRFIGGTFAALAAYIVAQAGWTLWCKAPPVESVVGIALAVASLVIMPALSMAKLRAANELKSGALRAEAKETLVCSYLSLTLLVGLVTNAKLGLWWADPVAALLMVPWLVKEGLEGLRGETCEDDCKEAR
jgi:divalent metal cation (Fe/Co/Zn/Cd) transporter